MCDSCVRRSSPHDPGMNNLASRSGDVPPSSRHDVSRRQCLGSVRLTRCGSQRAFSNRIDSCLVPGGKWRRRMMGSSVGVGRVADERQRLPAGGAACHNNADGTVSGGAGVRGGGRRKSRPSGRTPFSSGNSPSVIVVAAGAPLTFQTRYRGAACSVLRNNTKKGNLPLGPTLPDQYNLIRQLAVA